MDAQTKNYSFLSHFGECVMIIHSFLVATFSGENVVMALVTMVFKPLKARTVNQHEVKEHVSHHHFHNTMVW